MDDVDEAIDGVTKTELQELRSYPIHSPQDCIQLLLKLKGLLWMPERALVQNKPELDHLTDCKKTVFELHTLGWSENEEIVSALQDNTHFWTMCWQSTTRGGHYVFEVTDWPEKEKSRKIWEIR